MQTKDGKKLINELFEKIKNKQEDSTNTVPAIDNNMMKMLGGFTLLRLASMVQLMNVSFNKEELLSINNALNKIRKQ